MIKKSVFLSILFILAACCMMGGSTFAYFTDTQSATTELTTGTVKIKVEKKYPCQSDGHDEKVQQECEQAKLDCIENKPYLAEWNITNIGSAPVTLRANIVQTWHKNAASVSEKTGIGAEENLLQSNKKKAAIDMETVNGWQYNHDSHNGYYTYVGNDNRKQQAVLQPGETVSFSLPFRLQGGKSGTYNLVLTLNVTAYQADRTDS